MSPRRRKAETLSGLVDQRLSELEEIYLQRRGLTPAGWLPTRSAESSYGVIASPSSRLPSARLIQAYTGGSDATQPVGPLV